jgi:hypothetical protein
MSSRRRLLPLALLAAASALLAGCAPEDRAWLPTPAVTPFPGEGTFDPADDPVNESVGFNCRELIDDQTLYDWGSGNFALDVSYSPATGSAAADVVAAGGLACSWINLTSAETVDIAVAAPGDAALEKANSTAAATGADAAEIAPDTYFSVSGAVGHVDSFVGRYWITADSTWFGAPRDAADLIIAARSTLNS